jgi:hypothetical protein
MSDLEQNIAPPGHAEVTDEPDTPVQPAGTAPPGHGSKEYLRKRYTDLITTVSKTDNPEENTNKLNASMYLAERLNMAPEKVYRNFDTMTKRYWNEVRPPQSAWESIKQEFSTQRIQQEAANAAYDMLWSNPDNWEDRYQRVEQLRQKMPSEDDIKRHWSTEVLKSASRIAADVVNTVSEGWKTGLTSAAGAASAAAAAGQAGPQVATPEEIVTVPGAALSAFVAGTTAGSVNESLKQMAGFQAMEMMDLQDEAGEQFNPNIVRAMSLGTGLIGSAIELSQIKTLLKGVPGLERMFHKAARRTAQNALVSGTFKRKALNAMKTYGANVSKETGQELAQESVQMTLTELGKQLNNMIEGTDIDPTTVDRVMNRLKQVGAESVKGFSVLALPGAIGQNVGRPGAQGQPRQQGEPQREQPTPTTAEGFNQELSTLDQEYQRLIQDLEENPSEQTVKKARNLADRMDELENAMREDAQGQQEQQADTGETPAWKLTREQFQQQQAEGQASTPDPELSQSVQSPELRSRIREAMPRLSEEEVDGAALLVDLKAQTEGKSTDQWVEDNLAPEVFATQEQTQQALPSRAKAGVEFLEDGRALVHASKNADFSSWTHEMAHIFRRSLPQDQQRQAAQWAGADIQVDEDGRVTWTDPDAEEKFAEGFEAYLREGKAPNEQLKPLYQRFSDWLKRIYHTVKNRWQLSDDIRQVYDSILAREPRQERQPEARSIDLSSEEGRQQYAQVVARQKAQAETVPEGVTLGQFTEQLAQEAQNIDITQNEDARNALAGAGFTEVTDAKGNTSRVTPQAEPETLFQEDEHYRQVRDAVERGEWVPDEVLNEYTDEQWAQDEIERRERLRGEARTESSMEDYIAFMQDVELDEHSREYHQEIWRTAQEQPLSRQESNQRFIDSLTKEELSSMLGAAAANDELPSHVVAQTAAKKALNGEEISDEHYQKVLAQIKDDPSSWREFFATVFEDEEEIWQLQQEAEQEQTLTEIERLREQNRNLRREVKDAQQSVDEAFRKLEQERRVGRNFEQLAKERKQEISQQKAELRKLRNRVPAKEALRKDRERRKFREYVNKLIREIMRPPSAGIRYAEAKQIRDIQSTLRVSHGNKKRRFREEMNRILRETSDPELQAIAQEELKVRALKEMSLDELEDLYTQIVGLRNEGRKQKWLEALDERVVRENAKADILQELTGPKTFGPARGKGSKETDKAFRSNLLQRVQASTWNMLRIGEMLGPTSNKWLNEQVNQKVDDEYRAIDRIIEPAKEKMQELGITTRLLGQEETVSNLTYTHDEIIHMYIARQNPDSYAAIRHGNRITDRELDQFIDTLSENEIAWADYMMAQFSGENFDRINEVFIADQNASMKRVENYFPIRRQEVTSQTIRAEVERDLMSRTHAGRAFPNKGFTKERQEISNRHQIPMRLGATSVFLEQAKKQEHYVNFAILAKRLQNIYSDRKVREAITQNYGTSYLTAIDEYINEVNDPKQYQTYESNKLMNRLRTNVQVSALAGNITSLLNQFPAIFLYMRDAGPAQMVQAIGEAATNPKKLHDFVWENDPQVKHRSMEPLFNDIQNLKKDGYQSVVRAIGQYSLKPMQWLDQAMVQIGWKATYNRAIQDGATHEEAVSRAQKATLRTQPSGHEKDMPSLYRSDAARMFLMFTRSLNQMWNMMTHDMPKDLKQRNIKGFVAEATALALNGILIGAISRKRPPEDMEEVGMDIGMQILSQVPFGIEASAGWQGKWYAGRGVSLVGGFASSLGKVGYEGLFAEDTDWEDVANQGYKAFEEGMRVLGLPSVAVGRVVDTAETGDWWELIGGPPEDTEE